MRPFQRLLHRQPEVYRTPSLETSSSSSTPIKKQKKKVLSHNHSKTDHDHLHTSTPSTGSSHRRSRSMDRRLDYHSASTRRTQESRGRETRWFDRLGGSVASVGRPKSVDSSIRRTPNQSQQHRGRRPSRGRSRNRSKSRSKSRSQRRGRSRSKSAGRSTIGGTRRVPSSRHSPQNSQGDKSKTKRGAIEERFKGKESTSLHERVDSNGKWFPPARTNPRIRGEEHSQQVPTTSTTGSAKRGKSTVMNQPTRSSVFPITNSSRSTPPRRSTIKSSLPTAPASKSPPSAFQRWPRLSSFRQKTMDPMTQEFVLDPVKKQQLLTMVLGNNGSMFEEGSTLNAPKGEVMRTEPQNRIESNEPKAPSKGCGDYVVDAALMFEAISASPFICIQTMCCVQEDYLAEERNKLKFGAIGDQSRTTITAGPPVVIKVDGVTGAPKIVEIIRDEPSVSVFTGGTAHTRDGFWVPFGLENCGESVLEERDERSSTPGLSSVENTHRRRKLGPSFRVKVTGSDDIYEEGVSQEDFRPSSRTTVDVDDEYNRSSTSPISQLDDRSRSSESHSTKAFDDERRDDTSVIRYSLPSSAHSNDKVCKLQSENVDDNHSAQPVSPSWDDNSAAMNPQRKLDEWEQMEAKLKALLMQKDTVADIVTINSM